MVDENSETLRSVAWSELFPWLLIVRTFRLAISVRILVLAAVGTALMLFAWTILGAIFDVDGQMQQWLRPGGGCPWIAVEQAVPDAPKVPDLPLAGPGSQIASAPWQAVDPFFGTWAQLSRPLWDAFRPGITLSKLACLFLAGLSSLAIWAFFGAAITRIAVVQLSCDERVGLMPALRFACSKWLSYFAAPLFPLLGIALAGAGVWLFGFLLRADIGILLLGLVWPLFLIAGLIMAVLLLGLLFGWPLMFSTISAEGTDTFDALSRSYAYTFQRPLHYLFYAIVAAVLGWLGWFLVQNFAGGVVGLTYWTAGWSAGWQTEDVARVDAIIQGSDALSGIGSAGATVINFWVGCVKQLAVAFLYAYFFTAVTAIYLLLRRDVDATEIDEVFLDADASEEEFGLAAIQTDEAGAPEVVEGSAGEQTPEKPGEEGS